MRKLRMLTLFLVVSIMVSLCTITAYSDGAMPDGLDSNAETTVEGSIDTPEFDWDKYTLDELLPIQKALNETVLEKQKQYAIENGNRKITLNEEEFTVFTKKSFALVPSVERVLEDAPQKTSFVWTSSDNKVATVSSSGTVTGVAKGDAVITCTARDDELVFKTAIVHVALPVSSVTLSKKETTLLIDNKRPDLGKTSLFCTVMPEDAYVQDVTWKSDKEEIAAVDQNGVVTAVAPGRATITAYSSEEGSSKKASCAVTVLQAVETIVLDESNVNINKGSSKQLHATVMPEDASKKALRWSSSNESIARVSSSGTVTGVDSGVAVITCSAEDGSGALALCKVHIIQMVKGIQIKDYSGNAEFTYGEKKQLSAIVTPENATKKAVTWESSDSSVVKISKYGFLETVGAGTATLTCKATDGSEVMVQLSVYVPSISVDKNTYRVSSKNGLLIPIKFYGKKDDFKYSITPSGIVSASSSWAEDGKTVTLNLQPKAPGTVTVSLEDKNDSKSNQKITVVVPSQYVPNVTDSADWVRWRDSQFSPWNGKHIELEKLIISNLNDEKSYKHKETTYIAITNEDIRDSVNIVLRKAGSSQKVEIGDLFIETTFSAKNAFNATIKNTAYGISKYATNKIILVTIE